jgi:hypothetical protein
MNPGLLVRVALRLLDAVPVSLLDRALDLLAGKRVERDAAKRKAELERARRDADRRDPRP